MATFDVGVRNRPGARVRSIEPEFKLKEASFGNTLIVAPFERQGENLTDIVEIGSITQLNANTGTYLDNSHGPDCARQFLGKAKGAGKLYVMPVTDGSQKKASMPVYNQNIPKILKAQGSNGALLGLAITIEAFSSGRAGGQEPNKAGGYASTMDSIARLTDTTIDLSETGIDFEKDELKDAYIALSAVSNTLYQVISNTAGTEAVATVATDKEMLTDHGGGGDLDYFIYLDNAYAGGTAKGVSFRILDGKQSPFGNFGLEVYEHGRFKKRYDDISLDETSKVAMVDVVNNDASNIWIVVTKNWTGSATKESRPGNVWIPSSVSSASITLNIVDYEVTTGDANGYLSDVAFGSDVREDTLTLTFSNATTFAVTSTFMSQLGAGTVGTLYEPGHDQGFDFKVNAGTTVFEADDVMVIRIRPMTDEVDKRRAYVDAHTSANKNRYYTIQSHTANSITFLPGTDMNTFAAAAAGGTHEGTEAGPFTFALGVDDVFAVKVNGGSEQTHTLTSGNLAAVLASLQGSAITGVTFTAGTVGIVATGNDKGAEFNIEISAGCTAFTELGMTKATYDGSDGNVVRIEQNNYLTGGYDGHADIDDNDYIGLFDIDTSPLNELLDDKLGLVTVFMPGISSITVQQAAEAYCLAKSWFLLGEFPTSVNTANAATDWINDTYGNTDIVGFWYPSQVYTPHPSLPSAQKLVSGNGFIAGWMAKIAAQNLGYADAPAGTDYKCPEIIKLPVTGDKLSLLDEEELTPVGINYWKKSAQFFPFGDQVPSANPVEKWMHKTRQFQHYIRVVAESFDPLIFKRMNDSLLMRIFKALDDYFAPEYKPRGNLEEPAEIIADNTNNPQSEKDAGRGHAKIGVRIVNTLEQLWVDMYQIFS